MAKPKITSDMEYWQLREDHARTLLMIRSEQDKKKKKELEKESANVQKSLEQYEKNKIKLAREQKKLEERLAKSREASPAVEKIFFEVSPIETRYIDYENLNTNERERLAVKKESLIQAMKPGMYIRLKGDTGIYQVKQSDKKMNGMKYVSTVIYGNVTIQDIALIITTYYYAKELSDNGQTISD